MAAGGHEVLDKGFLAAEALTQFRFVTLVAGTDRAVDQADAAGELVHGVGQETISAQDATDGRITNVRMMGVSLVEAGGNVTRGTEVTTDASGRAVTATTTGHRVAGIALDSGVSGDWIAVLLIPAGRVMP